MYCIRYHFEDKNTINRIKVVRGSRWNSIVVYAVYIICIWIYLKMSWWRRIGFTVQCKECFLRKTVACERLLLLYDISMYLECWPYYFQLKLTMLMHLNRYFNHKVTSTKLSSIRRWTLGHWNRCQAVQSLVGFVEININTFVTPEVPNSSKYSETQSIF